MSVSLGLRGSDSLVATVAVVASLVLLAGVPALVPEAGAVGSCPNEVFRIGPSSGLPDCRAYEMVSPPDKNGGEVDGGVHNGAMAPPQQAAPDGESVTYGSTTAFIDPEADSAVAGDQYLSRRTASGWLTQAIGPAQSIPEGKLLVIADGAPDFSLFQGFSESLEYGFLLAWDPQPDPAAPASYFNPYLRNDGSGKYQLLSGVKPPVQPPGQADLTSEGFGVAYAGMSADGQHVIFEANDALTPNAIPGQVNLYEWSAGKPLELVSVMPEGVVDTSGGGYPIAFADNFTRMKFGGVESIGVSGVPFDYAGALSSDGKRAFWSGGISTGYQVYMHEITGSGARTVDVSASQKSGEPNGSSTYWAANREGSLVYFTSSSQLTDDSTAGAAGPDLYQYDANTGALRDLSVDPNSGEAADVLGVLGVGGSEEASYVYFVAKGKLAAGATAGAENLYVSHDGGSPAFIATLAGDGIDFSGILMEQTSRVSPDGQLLAFQSTAPLTGYDNRPAGGSQCPEPETFGVENYDPYHHTFEGRCMEVYEYDAQGARLTCVSCNRDGLPPTGDSLVPMSHHLLYDLLGWESSTVQQRYLLDDGRLYFQSQDALLNEATNGRQNVYEFEPEGVGQCAAGSGPNGCLYLISTGESSGPSFFVDAGADGRDVFILTSERLVPQDGDEAMDVYDVREDGGFSAAIPPPCSGEACKPAVTPAPAIYGPPSSATFQGVGNPPAAPAAKPAVKVKKTKQASGKKKSKRRGGVRSKQGGKRKARKSARSERGRR